MATSFSDLHSEIIQTHILPRLNGQSLSTTATVSSYLQTLSSDYNLWSHISKSTWPSITHPRIDDVISTFPSGHRSFFKDSFPSLMITDVNHRNHRRSWYSKSQQSDCSSLTSSHHHPCPSHELISAVDIRYQNDVIYSTVEFTDITTDFLSSPLRINLNESKQVPEISRLIDLKESLTLNWILIDPIQKRAGNLSSIKPVSVSEDLTTNDTLLEYVTVLPGCDPNEMVQCRIKVVLGVITGSVGLHVKEVMMKLEDLDCNCLNGREFLVITQGAISERNNVKRKVVDDERRWKSYNEFMDMKREKKEWVKREEKKKEFATKMNYVAILVVFCLNVYFMFLLLQ